MVKCLEKKGELELLVLHLLQKMDKNGCGIFGEPRDISYKEWEVKAFKQDVKVEVNPITFKENN